MPIMKTAVVVQVLVVLLAVVGLPSVGRAAERRPNVLIILADDQGWGDLSINGNTNLATPHIDSLASSGAMLRPLLTSARSARRRAPSFSPAAIIRAAASSASPPAANA